MAFGLGKLTDFLNKGERFPEMAESKGPPDTMGVVEEYPVRGLRTEAFRFLASEWWDAAAAGRACFLGKSFGHVCLSLINLFVRTMPTQSIYRSVPRSFLPNLSGQLFYPTC